MVLTALGFFSGQFWLADLACHFRFQYLAVLLIYFVICITASRYKRAGILAFFVLANAICVLPFYSNWGNPGISAKHISVMQLNAFYRNKDYGSIVRFIKKTNPDVVCIEELTNNLESYLRINLRDYPYKKYVPHEDDLGIGVFSKIPWKRTDILQFGPAQSESVVADLAWGSGIVRLVCVHPYAPISARHYQIRNEQLAALGTFVSAQAIPTVIVGDLNTTPYSAGYQQLLKIGQLHDASLGFGIRPTWPTDNFLLRIPIDHILISKSMMTTGYKVGEPVGSDHLPLLVDLVP
jgi:endonuclease/exonuclease/phosphatase (EEP) superfamily protein YafD